MKRKIAGVLAGLVLSSMLLPSWALAGKLFVGVLSEPISYSEPGHKCKINEHLPDRIRTEDGSTALFFRFDCSGGVFDVSVFKFISSEGSIMNYFWRTNGREVLERLLSTIPEHQRPADILETWSAILVSFTSNNQFSAWALFSTSGSWIIPPSYARITTYPKWLEYAKRVLGNRGSIVEIKEP